jgi:hypothetical protein
MKRNTPPAAAFAVAQQKSPMRHPARASSVVSVNTFFWKILVTRVKWKVISSIKSRVGKRYPLCLQDGTNTGRLDWPVRPNCAQGDATGRKVAPPAGSAAGLVMLDCAA